MPIFFKIYVSRAHHTAATCQVCVFVLFTVYYGFLYGAPHPADLLLRSSVSVPVSYEGNNTENLRRNVEKKERKKETKVLLLGNYCNFLEILTSSYPTFSHGTRYSLCGNSPFNSLPSNALNRIHK